MSTKTFASCLAVAALAFSAAPLSAQIEANQFFETDQFIYTDGEPLIDQGPWLLRGTATGITLDVEAGSLTYTPGGLPASNGNHVLLKRETGDDARFLFPGGAIPPDDGIGTENTYYWSAIVEWDGTFPGTEGHSSYLASFLVSDGATTTFFRGILRVTTDFPNSVYLGTQLYSSTNSLTGYAPTAIPANTPVFVVIKVSEVNDVRNDTCELFLFVNDPVPATEPVSPSASHTYSAGTGSGDILASNSGFGITGMALRQFVASGTNPDYPGNWRIDELRGGSTWTSVITGQTNVPDWSMY